jgi:hypothetical protein
VVQGFRWFGWKLAILLDFFFTLLLVFATLELGIVSQSIDLYLTFNFMVIVEHDFKYH